MPPLKWLFYLSDLSSILQREDNFSFIIIFWNNNCLYSSVVERWSCKLAVLGSICSSSCFVISFPILEQHEISERTHADLTPGILKHEVLHQWSNDFEVVSFELTVNSYNQLLFKCLLLGQWRYRYCFSK